jgi:hypothetical protein
MNILFNSGNLKWNKSTSSYEEVAPENNEVDYGDDSDEEDELTCE